MIRDKLLGIIYKSRELKKSFETLEKSSASILEVLDNTSNIADLESLIQKNEALKVELQALNSRYDDLVKRLNSLGASNGWIRWLTYGGDKDRIHHIKFIMDELRRLDPNHPVFEGRQGARPQRSYQPELYDELFADELFSDEKNKNISPETQSWIDHYGTVQKILEDCRVNSEHHSSEPFWKFVYSALTSDTSFKELVSKHFGNWDLLDSLSFPEANLLQKLYDKAKENKKV